MTAYGQTTQLFSTPYLTIGEFKNAPTSVAYDKLVVGGTAAQNDTELANLIARASSQIDAYCHQTLSATVDTWQTRARIGRDRMLTVHPRYFPIRAVLSLSYGRSPDAMTVVGLDSTVWVEERRIVVPAALIMLGGLGVCSGPVLVQVTYVNGYPNTILTADVDGSSLPLADTTGILPGDTLGVYDESNGTQIVVVADTWTPAVGPNTVPIVGSVKASLATSVSALPPAVKQATIHVVTGLLKSRGAGSLVMSGTNTPAGSSKDGGASYHFDAARALLCDFTRVV